jgi:hypothetical protein
LQFHQLIIIYIITTTAAIVVLLLPRLLAGAWLLLLLLLLVVCTDLLLLLRWLRVNQLWQLGTHFLQLHLKGKSQHSTAQHIRRADTVANNKGVFATLGVASWCQGNETTSLQP